MLRVPYMLENEPFDKLLVPHNPLKKFNHRPPILRLGFAIPDHVAEFRRAALKHNLGDPEELRTTKKSSFLRLIVMSHLNERCGLPPGQGMVCELQSIGPRARDSDELQDTDSGGLGG